MVCKENMDLARVGFQTANTKHIRLFDKLHIILGNKNKTRMCTKLLYDRRGKQFFKYSSNKALSKYYKLNCAKRFCNLNMNRVSTYSLDPG